MRLLSGLGNRAYLNLCTRLFRLSQFQNGLTTINKTMKIIVIVGTSFAIRYVLEEYLLSSFINFLFSPKNPDPEKLSAYECGFEAFGDSRMEFDVRFYLVAILFIIFDLEIAFLFPWAISLGNIGILGFTSMMIFLFILTIGFIYEWKKGALDWE